jgi:hypothetical protein
MGLSLNSIQAKFFVSHGNDPLFAAVDGANCPDNTSNDPASHSLLLKNGLIRVGLQLPATAQFKISVYRDPYGCAVVTDPNTKLQTVSVYRRPLPTTNLQFLSAIMFDGRETHQPLTSAATFKANLTTDLLQQSVDATLIHAQASVPPTPEQQANIVNFELGLSSGQALDFQEYRSLASLICRSSRSPAVQIRSSTPLNLPHHTRSTPRIPENLLLPASAAMSAAPKARCSVGLQREHPISTTALPTISTNSSISTTSASR